MSSTKLPNTSETIWVMTNWQSNSVILKSNILGFITSKRNCQLCRAKLKKLPKIDATKVLYFFQIWYREIGCLNSRVKFTCLNWQLQYFSRRLLLGLETTTNHDGISPNFHLPVSVISIHYPLPQTLPFLVFRNIFLFLELPNALPSLPEFCHSYF